MRDTVLSKRFTNLFLLTNEFREMTAHISRLLIGHEKVKGGGTLESGYRVSLDTEFYPDHRLIEQPPERNFGGVCGIVRE
ncbi:hypothetical protein JTE90_013543 [Oedothorax gibbosus]|uniref:Uncharacterized protein n=1 Tax=Oedothorax gibbosus TaxID=931172 RepID=A0AAV6U9W4_9ARAC|nr:hypothetical protein JTE90_013543 [Oedothorax gibbosus]